jgi:superfamily II DNA or RNA helicase
MIALHAIWSQDARLCLWGEHSGRSGQPRGRPGRPPKVPRPGLHPFSAGVEALRETVQGLGTGVAAEEAPATTLVLRLPSSPAAPLASPQLLRIVDEAEGPVGPIGLGPWEVDALALEPRDAAKMLLSLPHSPPVGIAYGDSVRFLVEGAKLALELVARGRLRPALERESGQWVGRWRPVTDASEDDARVALLVRSMPPLLRAELSPWEEGNRPEMIAEGLLTAVVDACARELLQGRLAELDEARSVSGGAFAAWLRALADDDPGVDGEDRDLAQLAEAVEQWWSAGRAYEEVGHELVLPEDEPDVAAWRVEFLLQHKEDPSVLVPAAEVWAHSERLSALGRMLENPQERLLGGLGHALRVWPDLAPALEQAAPIAIELTAEQAYGFLQDAVPLLEQAGFGVIAPPWWRQRPRATLAVRPEQEWEWTEGTGLFGADGLCAFEWQVAIGDARLTVAELEALAELKVPLVKARGRWIALRAEDVELALRFFRKRQAAGRATVAELLHEGLRVQAAGEEQPDVEVEAHGWLGDLLGSSGERRLRPVPTPRAFVGKLRPYQQRGLAWMVFMSSLGLGACLADDMGLGKTVQLIALLLAEREAGRAAAEPAPAQERAATGELSRASRPAGGAPHVGPTLLVCPVSVAGNWRREAERFAPSLRVHVHYGRERLKGEAFARAVRGHDLVVTTYALALRDRETLRSLEWERVVLDEAQHIKTRDAQQTRAIRALRARHRIALTGTPVENRLAELHSIMDFLNPGLLGSATSFRDQFATPIERWRDGAAAARLRRMTGPFILRRLKTDRDVISDLPDKIEMRVDCHLTTEQATLYQAVVDEMLERIALTDGIARSGIVLQALMKLKQVCNHPAHLLKDRSRLDGRSDKLARLEEILGEALVEGDKALCFTQVAEFGHQLRAHLQDRLGHEVLFLHGGTPKAARDRMVERFQSPEGPSLFVLSLKAGGTGLNLTAANHVIHFDRWWNPAVEDQATDRAFRIGQRKNVQVRKLTCVGTLEERIDRLIAEKRELAEQIVGSGEAWLSELDSGQLRELVALGGEALEAA